MAYFDIFVRIVMKNPFDSNELNIPKYLNYLNAPNDLNLSR